MQRLSDETIIFVCTFLYWSIRGIIDGHIDVFLILLSTFLSSVALKFMFDLVVPPGFRRMTAIAISILTVISFFVNTPHVKP